MEELKTLFGENALTYPELEALLKESGEIKLANLKSGLYVSKEKLERAEQKNAELLKKLEEANQSLSGYQELDVEGLRQAAADWEIRYHHDVEALEEKLRTQQAEEKISLALAAARAKNLVAARALIDRSALVVENGEIKGLSEQLETIVKENPYLFEGTVKNPPPPKPGGRASAVSEAERWRAEAGLPRVEP